MFPKWLQEKYSLWDQTYCLFNGTEMAYRLLKVPCCRECNGDRLASLENWICAKIEEGYDACSKAEEYPFFRWLAKIFLGILCKDLSLRIDRRRPDQGSILDPESVRRFGLLHFWLQVASVGDESGSAPGSLFMFRAQVPEPCEAQFDFMDDSANGLICVRMGEVVLIADFYEGGIHKESLWEFYRRYTEIPLHPCQVPELFAQIAYRARLLALEGRIEFFGKGDKGGYALRWKSNAEGESLYDPWVPSDYARVLSFYTHLPYDELYFPENDGVVSYLHDSEVTPVFWKIGEPSPRWSANHKLVRPK